MASDERLHLLPTMGQVPDYFVEIKVYRGSTSDRTHTLGLDIPSDLIASPHLWFHAPDDGPAYYEVNRPSVFRVPLKPNTSAPFEDGILKDTDAVKHLRYIVLGDASTKDGLAAPFDEEGTESIFKIEPLARTDLFDAWRQFANTGSIHWPARRARRVSVATRKRCRVRIRNSTAAVNCKVPR